MKKKLSEMTVKLSLSLENSESVQQLCDDVINLAKLVPEEKQAQAIAIYQNIIDNLTENLSLFNEVKN